MSILYVGPGRVWYMTFWIENDDDDESCVDRNNDSGYHPSLSIQIPPPHHTHTLTHSIFQILDIAKQSKGNTNHPIPIPIPIPTNITSFTYLTSLPSAKARQGKASQGKAEVATIPHLTSSHLTSHLCPFDADGTSCVVSNNS